MVILETFKCYLDNQRQLQKQLISQSRLPLNNELLMKHSCVSATPSKLKVRLGVEICARGKYSKKHIDPFSIYIKIELRETLRTTESTPEWVF